MQHRQMQDRSTLSCLHGRPCNVVMHRVRCGHTCCADNAAWDPRYHGSIMMAPVLYCTCLMAIVAATFALFVGLRLWQYRVAKRPFRAHHPEPHDEEEVGCL